MLKQSLKLIQKLQYKNGLFAAAAKDVRTGYNLSWLRDNVYISLGLQKVDKKSAIRNLRALLDILLKHEHKIDWMIAKPYPKYNFRYIHARYDPATMEEIRQEWGNKQNDAVGALLFAVGDFESKRMKVIRNDKDKRVLAKLVYYLAAIEYWHDSDNGMWEENEEVHASSVGACVAGLKKISKVIDVDPEMIEELIERGRITLHNLLPRESATKHTDLALLSLIYPYNVVTKWQKHLILRNVESILVRNKGVIRYVGDKYYNNGSYSGGEAEWCFGLTWLAIIHREQKNPAKYAVYMRKATLAMNSKGEMPELYYSNSEEHNENSPLGWAQAMYVDAVNNKFSIKLNI